MPLTHGLVPTLASLFCLALVLLAARWFGPRRSSFAAVLAVGLVASFAVGHAFFGWVDAPILASYYVCLAVPVFGLCLALTPIGGRWGPLRAARDRIGLGRRLTALVAALMLVPAGVVLVGLRVNQTYDYYPTVRSLFGGLDVRVVDIQKVRLLRRSRGANPPGGATPPHPHAPVVIHTAIPGRVSGFAARDAYVWLPPAYLDGSRRAFPVLLLLHGTPGQPQDWLRAGGVAHTALQYSRAHDGVAPIIVMPDINGDTWADTECVDSPRGNVETYLTRDVPDWIHHTFASVQRHWAIAGLSEGGTCAVMLALRHPALFDRFADFSGLLGPTVGDAMHPAATVRRLFDGSHVAYRHHSPVWLLEHHPDRGLRAIFAVGRDDTRPRAAQAALAALTRRDGIATSTDILPGRHNWQLWQTALAEAFPELVADSAPNSSGRDAEGRGFVDGCRRNRGPMQCGASDYAVSSRARIGSRNTSTNARATGTRHAHAVIASA